MQLKVEGFSPDTTEEELKEVFSGIGSVESTLVIRDIYSGRSRGFGFVQMTDKREGEEAVRRFHGSSLKGRLLEVKATSYPKLLPGEMELREWMSDNASEVLKRVGIKNGDIVVDFGCGKGRFTIPCAGVVGEEGKVYAVEIRPSSLEDISRVVEKRGLRNIVPLPATQSAIVGDLQDLSVDAVIVYDVMQEISDREKLLHEVHRILRQEGFLSIFPMHLGTERMLEIMGRCDLFRLRDRYCPSGHKTASEILNFNKRLPLKRGNEK